MRLYKSFLVVCLIAAIGFGIWYCVSVYLEESSGPDGTLVYMEEVESDAEGTDIY